MGKLPTRQFLHFLSNMKCNLLFTSNFLHRGIIDAYCSIPETPLFKWFGFVLSPPESVFNDFFHNEWHIHPREHRKRILEAGRIYPSLQQSNVRWVAGGGREAANSLLPIFNNTRFQQCSQAPLVLHKLSNRK